MCGRASRTASASLAATWKWVPHRRLAANTPAAREAHDVIRPDGVQKGLRADVRLVSRRRARSGGANDGKKATSSPLFSSFAPLPQGQWWRKYLFERARAKLHPKDARDATSLTSSSLLCYTAFHGGLPSPPAIEKTHTSNLQVHVGHVQCLHVVCQGGGIGRRARFRS